MTIPEHFGERKEFLSRPEVAENSAFLREVGVFDHVNFLEQEIKNFRDLFTSTMDIFTRSTVEEIMDAAVRRISDYSSPSVVVFLWKPLQNREEIVIKGYKDYKPVDLGLNVPGISCFEPFFRKYPRPINYELFSFEFGQSEIFEYFDRVNPSLVIPIMGPSGGLYGMVLLGNKAMGQEYSIAELSFIQHFMSFVSLAIQNNLHYERTLRDVKTGLYNNAFFLTRLNEEIARSRRNEYKTSIIMLDIDHFKRINDTYGHIAGDRVLESLAITIKQALRSHDVPSRFGGEEFTVLLPDTGKDEAFLVAERLRNIVAEMDVPWEPSLPRITVSLGVCTFYGRTGVSSEEIMKRTDEALYMSKEQGRNRTTVWEGGLLDKIEKRFSGSYPPPRVSHGGGRGAT
ncbi:MAG: sensor domain-containing diguanylate cyclase [Treponema sp.]|nr:sensor domain-containing diguanylate cyclase [Treponema sp.]